MIITGVFTNTQLLFVVGVLLGCVHWTVGTRLLECSQSITKVPENSVHTLTCVDTRDSLAWNVANTQAATCDSSTCTTREGFSHVLAIRPNASSSVLHIDVTKYRGTLVSVQCASGWPYDHCVLISVYTEMPVSCQFNVSTENRRVSGACDIAKIFASNNQYYCRWNEVFNDQSAKVIGGTFDNTLYTDSETGRKYRRGVCSFSSTFFALQGVFKYTHHMDPGIPVHVATIVVHEASDITVSGPSFVATSVDGSPGSVEETTSIATPTYTTRQMATPTTSDSGTSVEKMTSTSATASDITPTTDEASDITVSGPSFVATSVDGSPGSVEETTSIATPTYTTRQMATPTTSDSGTSVDKMTSTSATASDITPTTEFTIATTTSATLRTTTGYPSTHSSESTSLRSTLEISELTTSLTTLTTLQDGSEKTPGPQDAADDSNITAYVAGGVAGGLGLIIIVVLGVFGVLILRKMSDVKRGTVQASGGRTTNHDVSRPRAREMTEWRPASMAEPEHIYSETYAEPVAPDPHTALQNDMGYLPANPNYITPIPDDHKV